MDVTGRWASRDRLWESKYVWG